MREGMLYPVHICIRDVSELGKLQGSKYVQSDLGSCFYRVRECLREKIPVLFAGTPCQVDALKHFLNPDERLQLYTMDLVCHGVPSAELFRAYLKHMKKDVTSFWFRSKSEGWGLRGSYTYRCGSMEKTKDLPPNLSSYYSYFLESEIYRESCYTCPYANGDRVGDLTIGDFWGIENAHPEHLKENGGLLDSKKGVSMIFANTAKGLELLETYGNELLLLPAEAGKVIQGNRQLAKPSCHTPLRDALAEIYAAKGYSGVEKLWRKKLGIRYPVRVVRERYRCVFKTSHQ
jgi:coenzyme F420-reducing hydrogenase beta subunit